MGCVDHKPGRQLWPNVGATPFEGRWWDIQLLCFAADGREEGMCANLAVNNSFIPSSYIGGKYFLLHACSIVCVLQVGLLSAYHPMWAVDVRDDAEGVSYKKIMRESVSHVSFLLHI